MDDAGFRIMPVTERAAPSPMAMSAATWRSRTRQPLLAGLESSGGSPDFASPPAPRKRSVASPYTLVEEIRW